MLTATLGFIAVDHHANAGGFAKLALQFVREHSYKDVYDVLTSPAAALMAWTSLLVVAIASVIKFIKAKASK